MKNKAMSTQPSGDIAVDGWRHALLLQEQDLRRRGAAEKTRRAYGIDTGQFARWAAGRGRWSPSA